MDKYNDENKQSQEEVDTVGITNTDENNTETMIKDSGNVYSNSGEKAQFDDAKNNVKNNGVKVFVSILCISIAIIIAVLAGFIAGRSINNPTYTDGVSVNKKPIDVQAYDTETVYSEVAQSVVGITVYNASGTMRSNATGVIYSENGYIVTNDHIYSEIPSPKFIVTMNDLSEYDATFVAGDIRSDLAVLKIDASGLKAATFGDSEEICVGEKTAAVGYSAGPSEGAIFTCGYTPSP